jgi:hypothetical protein
MPHNHLLNSSYNCKSGSIHQGMNEAIEKSLPVRTAHLKAIIFLLPAATFAISLVQAVAIF